jgi:hypothetical protein
MFLTAKINCRQTPIRKNNIKYVKKPNFKRIQFDSYALPHLTLDWTFETLAGNPICDNSVITSYDANKEEIFRCKQKTKHLRKPDQTFNCFIVVVVEGDLSKTAKYELFLKSFFTYED